MLSAIRSNETMGYSQAVRVGDVLHVSGQVAVDERGEVVGRGDIRAHVEQVFKKHACRLRRLRRKEAFQLGS